MPSSEPTKPPYPVTGGKYRKVALAVGWPPQDRGFLVYDDQYPILLDGSGGGGIQLG